eukprot:Nk52_evm78s210 gene=Nk52_evmTU78s210
MPSAFYPKSSWSGRKLVFAFGVLTGSAVVAAYSSTQNQSYVLKKSYTGFNDMEFIKFRLVESREASPTSKYFRFALMSKNAKSGIYPASCVITRFEDPETGEKIVRPYTPITSPRQRGYFELLVKKYEGGKMSNHIHNLKPGDSLECKGPIKKKLVKSNAYDEMGFVAGGTGINPMYQIIQETLQNEVDRTLMTLVYSCKNEDELLLKDELNTLVSKYPGRLRVHYVITNPKDANRAKDAFLKTSDGEGNSYRISEQAGEMISCSIGKRIDEGMLKSLLPEVREKILVWVCGPPGFIESMSGPKADDGQQGELGGYLQSLRYHRSLVYKL